MPLAEIFSQGDELVTGEIADTNAAWLSRELTALGFEVGRHTTVGDRLEALVELLGEIRGRADLCLCTGGLGPTSDDLTAEAAALAFGRPLELDPEALVQIESWFTRHGRRMPAVNRKQALLPQGSERLDNLWGTAPGFALDAGRCRFAFMPGVPGEMEAMFRHWVRPDLERRFERRPGRRVVLRTIGLGESALQEKLDRIKLPAEARLGFRAGGSENLVKLAFPPDFPEPASAAAIGRAVAALGEAVYAVGAGDTADSGLEAVVGRLLAVRNARLQVLETCSGGTLASRCGGESWFAGALVEPDPVRLLARFGVEAAPDPAATASRLAETARARLGADYLLLQYGEFDRERLTSETAKAEVIFVLATATTIRHETRILRGEFKRKRDSAAALSLDFVRRCLAAEPE